MFGNDSFLSQYYGVLQPPAMPPELALGMAVDPDVARRQAWGQALLSAPLGRWDAIPGAIASGFQAQGQAQRVRDASRNQAAGLQDTYERDRGMHQLAASREYDEGVRSRADHLEQMGDALEAMTTAGFEPDEIHRRRKTLELLAGSSAFEKEMARLLKEQSSARAKEAAREDTAYLQDRYDARSAASQEATAARAREARAAQQATAEAKAAAKAEKEAAEEAEELRSANATAEEKKRALLAKEAAAVILGSARKETPELKAAAVRFERLLASVPPEKAAGVVTTLRRRIALGEDAAAAVSALEGALGGAAGGGDVRGRILSLAAAKGLPVAEVQQRMAGLGPEELAALLQRLGG